MTTKPTPPKGCADLLEHERKLTALAELLETHAKALFDEATPGQRIGLATANQLAASAVNARRRAAELTKFREELDHDRYLVEQAKLLRGNSQPPRQRLRRMP